MITGGLYIIFGVLGVGAIGLVGVIVFRGAMMDK